MYIYNKDCSEYCEDFIKENGGRLLSLMFFELCGPTQRKLRAFNHRLRMDQICELELYNYHTVVMLNTEDESILDITNGMTRTTLQELAEVIYRNNNGFHTNNKIVCYAVVGSVPDNITTWQEFQSKVPKGCALRVSLEAFGETGEFN